jgi:hypothetical protein
MEFEEFYRGAVGGASLTSVVIYDNIQEGMK